LRREREPRVEPPLRHQSGWVEQHKGEVAPGWAIVWSSRQRRVTQRRLRMGAGDGGRGRTGATTWAVAMTTSAARAAHPSTPRDNVVGSEEDASVVGAESSPDTN
jgi:hypothetical protein